MKKALYILAFVFLQSLLLISAAYAQAPPPSSNPPGAPIDALAAALLAAGVGYGYSKLNKEKT